MLLYLFLELLLLLQDLVVGVHVYEGEDELFYSSQRVLQVGGLLQLALVSVILIFPLFILFILPLLCFELWLDNKFFNDLLYVFFRSFIHESRAQVVLLLEEPDVSLMASHDFLLLINQSALILELPMK